MKHWERKAPGTRDPNSGAFPKLGIPFREPHHNYKDCSSWGSPVFGKTTSSIQGVEGLNALLPS